jgi:chemotaxis protein CheD
MPSAARTDITLLPGDYFVGGRNYRVRTLLGSCVSVTLWHPGERVGAMSHYLLTRPDQRPRAVLNGRYGDDAMALMLAGLRSLGIDERACQAKVFGGASMFPELKDAGRVGQLNGRHAHDLLARHGIALVSESLYGDGPRQIIFDIGNGDVWSRLVCADSAPVRAGERT